MANPQPTDAHIRIAHTIQEQMMVSNFTEQQRRILDLILRLSWGCGKKYAVIPRQRDFQVVGVREVHIKNHIDWLINAKVIYRDNDQYSFNKDFDQWRVSRAIGYTPKKLTELVSLNLTETYGKRKFDDEELTENVSENLRKTLEIAYEKRKFSTSELATPKEILKKYIYTGDIDELKNGNDGGAGETWEKALAWLSGQVSKPNYDTWIKTAKGIVCRDGKYYLGVPNTFAADYLVNQRSLIERSILQVSGEQVEVEFVICPNGSKSVNCEV